MLPLGYAATMAPRCSKFRLFFTETSREVDDRVGEHRHPLRGVPLLQTRPQGLRAGTPG